MRYQIIHETTYTYSQQVFLEPHWLRLRSRCDGKQTLKSFSLKVVPTPAGCSEVLDISGNAIALLSFNQATEKLKITATSEVETYCTNPFNYLVEPWATKLPIDYPGSLLSQLHPYFSPLGTAAPIDQAVLQLAEEIYHAVSGQTIAFLSTLNQQIYHNCLYQKRETGEPLPPGITWKQKAGTCRDFTVLFIEACRAIGLAARFVSGYQEGDPNSQQQDLHAWAEVYLPGAGWRGYDPTHGLAVADRHIALVASTIPRDTAPISGAIRTADVKTQMQVDLSILAIMANC